MSHVSINERLSLYSFRLGWLVGNGCSIYLTVPLLSTPRIHEEGRDETFYIKEAPEQKTYHFKTITETTAVQLTKNFEARGPHPRMPVVNDQIFQSPFSIFLCIQGLTT